jgi:glucose-6-phosphate 1-dehydrogenase
MINTNTPTIIVIIGITGDLAKRKLLPAIDQLSRANVLPEHFQIVGITRRSGVNITDFTKAITDPSFIQNHTELFQMDVAKLDEYSRLDAHLQDIERRFGVPTQRLFYLSIPPQVSQPIITSLGVSGLAKINNTKLLLEKPFGVDLASATNLVTHINKYFSPEQVYRIDHYLAKEMTQNLIVFREENVLFKKTWHRDFIDSIHITMSEEIGIEGRSNFYEQTGALRDVIQSHLLQLAALTLMDISKPERIQEIPMRRLHALQQLRIADDSPITKSVKRGQYEGYRQEVNNPGSTVETFVSLRLQSKDSRWQGVPITLATGKRLKERATEIHITYRQEGEREANELILRLQPDEGVEMCLWTKRPGYEQQIEKRSLQFSYKEDERLPEAYEHVFLDAIRSDHTLFATSEEVLETWRILNPMQQAWEASPDDLKLYKPGSDIFTRSGVFGSEN